MPKTLVTPAILSSYRPKTDGSMTLSFATQALSDEQKVDVISHYQQFGWLGFVDSEDATDLEIPQEAPVNEGKSYSERLYNVMFAFHATKYKDKSKFNDWRAKAMESLIESYKEKIREIES